MKAFVYTRYGPPDVLEMKETPKPVPRDGEVLVKVEAASVNAIDWHFLTADIFLIRFTGGGFFKPKNPRLGRDIAGRVEAVGGSVTLFKPGDEVYGSVNGGFAEYVAAPEKALALKPANLTFEEAAAVPIAAVTALQGLRDIGQVQPGQRVLINGASGGVGTFAVQIAKLLGAEVTAVCSTAKLDLARSLGADHVVDYTREDFTQRGPLYDLIFAVNGYRRLSAYKRVLTSTGTYVMAGGSPAQIFQGMILGSGTPRAGGKQVKAFTARIRQNDLLFLKGLLEAGTIVPVIDKRFPFQQAPEALRYLGAGHAGGKVVISM